jgi:4-oxalocrotonate tautomerase family enzyme
VRKYIIFLEEVMPLVKIEIIKGKSLEYKKTVLDAVHVALENAIQIENWDRFQRLYEIEDDLFERSESKTDKFTMIEITMFPGRTKEQKSKLYKEIVKELNQRLGIEPTDIFIVINEPANENWGLAGIQREG